MSWKPFTTAPKTGGDHVPPFEYGPWIDLRNVQANARGRWRSALTQWDWDSQANHTATGRWEDRQGDPVPFEPLEWSEVDE